MRTYGRIKNPDGSLTWVVVQTTPEGYNDFVWLTTLIQNLKLFLNESPFYANNGIPAAIAVIQQVFPDFYVARIQQQFARYFASLIVAKVPDPTPTYNVSVLTNQGVKLNVNVPIPQ